MDLADLSMILEGIDADPINSESATFLEAVEAVRRIQGLDNETQLQLYGLYKQSTVGDVNIPKPWAIDFVGSAKWDAWKEFEGFPRESAARAYVYVVDNLLPKPTAGNGSSSSGSSSSGAGGDKNAAPGTIFDGMGVTTSSLAASARMKDSGAWKDNEALFKAVVDGDLEEARRLLEADKDCINARNATLMTPLHYAVDRGNADIVRLLLEHGADTEAEDEEGQLPITIAGICDYEDIVSLLLAHASEQGGRGSGGGTTGTGRGSTDGISVPVPAHGAVEATSVSV